MTFIKQTLKNTASLMLAVWIIGSAYAAIFTVSSGDPLTADSWNQIVNKISNTDTNSDDLVTKSYVDATVSANSWGYPVVKDLSTSSQNHMSHIDAINYCKNLTEDWFSDWRLWTQEELSLLVWHENASWISRSLSMSDGDYRYYYSVNLDNWRGYEVTYDDANSTAYFVNCVR